MKTLLPWAALILALTLPGCSSHCDLHACDIRESDCQRAVNEATACLRGVPVQATPTRVISLDDYIKQTTSAATSDPAAVARFATEQRALVLLELAPPGQTVEAASRTYASAVAAYYSRDTKSVTVIDHGSRFDSFYSVALLVHEYMHAIQDQTIGLNSFFGSLSPNFDAQLSASSITEGEATWLQDQSLVELFGTTMDEAKWSRVFRDWQWTARYNDRASKVPAQEAWQYFRYPFGEQYVQQVHRRGGWPAVDGIYQSPPSSTAQILAEAHGEAAPVIEPLADQAVPVVPDTQVFATTSNGAWLFESFLRHQALQDQLKALSRRCKEEFGFLPLLCANLPNGGMDEARIASHLRGDQFTILTAANGGVMVSWRLHMDDPALVELLGGWMRERRFLTQTADRDLIILATDDPVLGARITQPLTFMPAGPAEPMLSMAARFTGCVNALEGR